MKIAIAADHGGYILKGKIIKHLEDVGCEYIDLGTDSGESVDYPIYAHRVCEKIQNGEAELGILVCGTGIGMSLAANKHRGIRAACCSDTYSARLTRMHNNANVICLGERVLGEGLALDIVDAFLNAVYEGGRHQRRVDMLMSYEDDGR